MMPATSTTERSTATSTSALDEGPRAGELSTSEAGFGVTPEGTGDGSESGVGRDGCEPASPEGSERGHEVGHEL
jgi:hypothetical protein